MSGRASFETVLALALVMTAPAAAAPHFPQPPLPPEVALKLYGAGPEVGFLQGRELLRRVAPPLLLDYPGRRDSYLSLGEGEFDVTRVDVDLFINLDQKEKLDVVARVELVPLVPKLKQLQFQFELPQVEGVTCEPALEFKHEHKGSIVTLTFDSALPVEEPLALTFTYGGKMNCDVQFMLPTCKLEGPWRYVTHSRFLPSPGGSTELFTGRMRLFISGKGFEKWHAGGTGTYVGTVLHPEAREIIFEHIYPTSLFAWSASTMTTVSSMAGAIPISATVPLSQASNMGTILNIVQDTLDLYNSIYVPYPWNKLDLVAMPKSFSGGFGPLSTVFITTSMLNATPDNNSIYGAMQLISHEIGHEWWGNLVEMADGTAIVLSEGLTEFSSNYFFERATGSRAAFVDNSMAFSYTVPLEQEPLMVSPFVYASPYYYQIAYQKGAAVIDMLRLEIGDETLLAALKEMTQRYYMEFAVPEQLFEVLEEVSGQELDYFYQQWLAGRGNIVAGMGALCAPESGPCRLRVKQTAEQGTGKFVFNLPLHVLYQDGSSETVTVRVEEWEEEFELPVDPAQVRRIYPDLRRQLARIWRPLLPGDIDLSGTVDGADLLEMSFAYQINLLVASDWGEYFYANPSYNELADLDNSDHTGALDGRIDQHDLELLLNHMGQSLGPAGREPDGPDQPSEGGA